MKLLRSFTLKEIAGIIDGKMMGDANFQVTGINEIHKVENGDLTFVDHPKYYKKALNSAATTIIINKEMEPPEGKALFFSDDPFVAYNNLVAHFSKFERTNQMIDPEAEIGKGTHLQPGVFIGKKVKIGKNCLIHANVTINAPAIIGNNVVIHSGTVIGGDKLHGCMLQDN